MEKVLHFFKSTMEVPPAWGAFHLVAIALVVVITFLLCLFFRNANNNVFRLVLIIIWAVMFTMEAIKQVEEAALQIMKRFGRVDVLVNNAGIAQIKMFTDTTEEDWDRMMGVNVRGLYNTCRAFVPQMISRKSGRIINLSSMWGIAGASCEVAYSTSKAAVIGFTKSLAKELGPSGITVNCVAPGVIDTEMNEEITPEVMEELRNEIPLQRIGSASEVAGVVSFLASQEARYVTGQVISVDGGIL